MDARQLRFAVLVTALWSLGAAYRTPNFVVTADSPQIAEEVARSAEQLRRDLAITWLGSELENWPEPCRVEVAVGEHLGAGGATRFVFHHGQVSDWHMTIQGSRERLLDSVLPHEVTHTIFASHFRRPLPRWADEGACTTVEHVSERAKQQRMLIDFLQTGRGIAFSRMFAMTEYPTDIMPLYSQGYSLARYLIEEGGRQKYLAYIGEGMETNQWVTATRKYYGYPSLTALQNSWLDWVRVGSPQRTPGQPRPEAGRDPVMVASNEPAAPQPADELTYRGQTPGRLADALGRLVPFKQGARGSAETAATDDQPAPRADAETASATTVASDDGWRPSREAAEQASYAAAATGPAPAELEADPREPGRPAHSIAGPGRLPRTRQVVVEWERDSAGSGNAATQAAPVSTATRPKRRPAVIDASRADGSTVLR